MKELDKEKEKVVKLEKEKKREVDWFKEESASQPNSRTSLKR